MDDKPRGNRHLMRLMNMKIVLDAVRAADTISQAQLVRDTQLSVGTIVRIIGELKRRGLVDEVGLGESRVGRRPVQLRFNRTKMVVVAVDFEPDETTLAVLDLGGQVLHSSRFPFKATPTPQQFVDELKQRTGMLLRRHRIVRRKVGGIGVATHGSTDYQTGIVNYSRHLGWRNVPLGEMVAEAMKMPVRIESHARTMTIAEQRWGAGAGAQHLSVIEIDVGIGVVTISDGRIVRGANGFAGELGQDLIDIEPGDGPALCLEDVASGKAMVEAALNLGSPALRERMEGQSLRLALRALFDAASDGDRAALQIVQDAARHMGHAVAHVINLYDPQRVILAGSAIAESRGIFISQVRDVAVRRAFNMSDRSMLIEPATLGDRASLLGAAAMIYDDLFDVSGPLLR